MRFVLSDNLIPVLEKMLIDDMHMHNMYIPDGKLSLLVEYIKKKIKWTTVFNLRHTILNYIESNSLMYTDTGDALYKLLDYKDDCTTKSKESTSILNIQIYIAPAADQSLNLCQVFYKITSKDHYKFISKEELLDIEATLDMNCCNMMYNFFNNEYEFILRKGIYDLNIEVNSDDSELEFSEYDDF
jgi:hypothetical protein